MNEDHKRVIAALRTITDRRPNAIPISDTDFYAMQIEALDLDSIDKLDLVMALEEAFGIVFVSSDVLACKTVSEVTEFIVAERNRN